MWHFVLEKLVVVIGAILVCVSGKSTYEEANYSFLIFVLVKRDAVFAFYLLSFVFPAR